MAASLLRPGAAEVLLVCIIFHASLSSILPVSGKVIFLPTSGPSPSPLLEPSPLPSPLPEPFPLPPTLPTLPSPPKPPKPSPPVKLAALTDDPLDIWIIAGQSNAVGFNYMDGQPMPRPCGDPVPGKLLMFPIATQTWTDAQPSVSYISFGYTNFHAAIGPELRFGRELIEQNVSGRVGIIPTAVSNTDLCNNWLPPKGVQWLSMMKSVQAGMAAAGGSARLRGLIWVQGESDASNFYCASSYQKNFRTFVGALRQATQKYNPQLPVVMAVMSTTNRLSKLPYIDMIRQTQLANDTQLPNIVKVDMEGLEFFNQNPGQGTYWLHLTKSAQCTMGSNMANAWKRAALQ